MASRSIDLGGLPAVSQGAGFDVDSLIKIAALMQNQHENALKEQEAKSKFGTPATPTLFSNTPKRGFSPVPSAGDVPQPMMPGMDGAGNRIDPLLGGGAAPLMYAREGTPAIMGSVEFAQRNAMANSVLTPDKSDKELNEQAQLLYGETGPNTLAKLQFSSKTAKPLHVISDLESQMLAGLGVNLEPGKVLTGDEFSNLNRLIGLRTQGRLAENQELILKKLGYDITNIKATIEEKATDIEKKKESLKLQKKAMEILGGDASKTGSDSLLNGGPPPITGISTKAAPAAPVEPPPKVATSVTAAPPNILRALMQAGDGSEVDASDGFTYAYAGGAVTKKKTKRK